MKCLLFKCQENIDLDQDKADVGETLKGSGQNSSVDPSGDGMCHITRLQPTSSCMISPIKED